MPTYMGTAVGDPWLQNLVEAYRKGMQDAGQNAEQGDADIIKRLEENKVTVAGTAPTAYELAKNDAPHVEHR